MIGELNFDDMQLFPSALSGRRHGLKGVVLWVWEV